MPPLPLCSKWETGASSPDLENAISLCTLFQLSLDDFVQGEDAVPNTEQLSLKDLLTVNRRLQRMTIMLTGGLFFLMIGALAALFIAALRSTTLSIEYMLYRYIAVGEYAYAPVDYWQLILPAILLTVIGIILCLAYLLERRKDHKQTS